MSDEIQRNAGLPDSVIHARWVIPVEPERTTLEDHCVVVRNGRIDGLLPYRQAREQYHSADWVDCTRHVLIPGMINSHTHAAMTLFRGMADDLPLMSWLNEHIWPAEARWMGPDMVRDGTELAVAEMLLSGTTCFNDMYFFPNIVAKTAQAAGIRAVVGLIVIDFPTAWAASKEEYFDKGLEVHDEVRNLSLVTDAFAPHAPYSVADDSLQKIRMLADELDIPVHIHLHETANEIEDSISKHGVRPLERLDQLGLLSPRLLAVHMTQLLPPEADAVQRHGVNIAHCPESNLKLNSGYCPVSSLLAAGTNVSIGTDSAASNNDLDMLGEMRTAALLAKTVADDATALPAWQALEMATINGARALGLETDTGSLVTGKSADMVAIDMDQFATQPVYDPVSQLVYSAGREQVSDVWVSGRRVVQDRILANLDPEAIIQKAGIWRDKIVGGER